MPSWLRNDIQGFLYDISTFFRKLSYRFEDAADWADEIPAVGYYIAYALHKVEDRCWDANLLFKDLMWGWLDLCDWLDNLWDDIGYLWDDLNDLWNYAHGWLRDKAVDAYNWAVIAYDWAGEALGKVNAIAGVIGTTFTEIVQFIKDHATNIYQTINEYITNVYETINEYITNVYQTIVENIYNTYQTIKEYITNVYETITNVFNTYVTNIIGVAEDWVRDFVAAALAPFAAPINLINLWFDSIQNFFNDPLGWLWARFGDWFFGPEK